MAGRQTLEVGSEGKRSFVMRSPLMPAAGFFGYGRTYSGVLDARLFGALVTQPTTLHPLPGKQGPGFARLRGGFILAEPRPNPGVSAALREFAPSWRRWQVPVIVAVAVADAAEAGAVAGHLEREESVSAIELQVPPDADETWLAGVIVALVTECELPILVKLPLARATQLAGVAIANGAAALVLGTPYWGTEPLSGISGPVYGPATLPYTILALQQLAGSASVPLIASSGIYTAADLGACLQGGAKAVQLDGLIFLDPAAAADLARTYAPAASVDH
ncbi:MAG: hypothetical protein ACUVWR_02300 [Anaerolineae bacterium]